MTPAARTPYQDTSVPVERSKEQIRVALKKAGARGVQFDELWEPEPLCQIRFLWPLGEDDDAFTAIRKVRMVVKPLPPERSSRGSAWSVSPEQRERQVWRGVAWYLDAMLKAATFNLLKAEDIFLSFFEDDTGTTVGEYMRPMLETSGQLLLPKKTP
jgi:hypothetical protein